MQQHLMIDFMYIVLSTLASPAVAVVKVLDNTPGRHPNPPFLSRSLSPCLAVNPHDLSAHRFIVTTAIIGKGHPPG